MLASQYGGGIISIYLDETIIGSVNSSNTGGWQIYESVKFNKKTLPAGKHYSKLVATKGGFNMNWIDIAKKLVTNIEDIDNFKFQISPNPAQDKLLISCLGFDYKKIEVFDISGKRMLSIKALNGEQSIDVDLPDGMYFLVLSNSMKSLKRKFVIRR